MTFSVFHFVQGLVWLGIVVNWTPFVFWLYTSHPQPLPCIATVSFENLSLKSLKLPNVLLIASESSASGLHHHHFSCCSRTAHDCYNLRRGSLQHSLSSPG